MVDDTSYSIKEMISEIRKDVGEKFSSVDEKLDKVIVQTTEHNHRMSKMEKWKSYIQGGLAVMSIFIIPTFAWLVWQIVNIDTRIRDINKEDRTAIIRESSQEAKNAVSELLQEYDNIIIKH
jgi:uncharacterized membrane protein (DUF106 family)